MHKPQVSESCQDGGRMLTLGGMRRVGTDQHQQKQESWGSRGSSRVQQARAQITMAHQAWNWEAAYSHVATGKPGW